MTSLKKSFWVFALAGALVGCEVPDDSTNDGSAGGDTTDAAASDGSCCAGGDCVCRGGDPTESTIKAKGPFKTASYTSGMRNGPSYGAATIYYPTNAPAPLSGIVMCPGFMSVQSSLAAWGPFLASHGIVLMLIDTNTTMDQVIVRDDALLDALTTLKAENTRNGSPLKGKLTSKRFGLSGWSMGGGGTWLATQANPSLKTGMTFAGHNSTAGGGLIASGIKVPTIMFAGSTDTCILGGCGQSQASYQAIPSSTPKILYEVSGLGHFSFGTPTANSSWVGAYAISFQKTFLEGDTRYRKFLLKKGPNASDWRSNIQ